MKRANMPRREYGSIPKVLDGMFGERAHDGSISNREISTATMVDISSVAVWRRKQIASHILAGGDAPVCGCGKPFMHRGTCIVYDKASRPRPTGPRKSYVRKNGMSSMRTILDDRCGDLACDWTVTNSEISRATGVSGPNVVHWRRMHLRGWVERTGIHPDCACGLPFMHRLTCTTVSADQRRECERMLEDDEEYHVVAARTHLPPSAVTSLAIHLFGLEAVRPKLERARAQRGQRTQPAPHVRRFADDAHRKIAETIGSWGQESEDAVQEAYLAMLEQGLDIGDAVKIGRRTAGRMASVRWGTLSLDAPIGDDGVTTMLDLRADDKALDAFDEVLERLDMEAQGADPEWEAFSTMFDIADMDNMETDAELGSDADGLHDLIPMHEDTNVVPFRHRAKTSPAAAQVMKNVSDDELVAMIASATRRQAEMAALRIQISEAMSAADAHRRRAEDAERVLSNVFDVLEAPESRRLAA